MTINEAFDVLDREDAAIQERRIGVADLTIDQGGLVAGDERIRISPTGFERLARHVGAPPEYLTRLEAPVRARLLQHHFSCGDAGPDAVNLVLRNGWLIAVGRADLVRLSGREVLGAVLDAVGQNDLQVHALDAAGETARLTLLSERVAHEVSVGDVIQAGIEITHSTVGLQATWIKAFLLRLVCANGMTHRQCVSQKQPRVRRLPATHPAARQRQIDQVRRLAVETFAGLDAKLQSLKALQQESTDVEPLLQQWIERARLSRLRVLPRLLHSWRQDGSRDTVYAAMNALTWVATHDAELSARERQILSGLAGVLAFRRMHVCPRCFSVLRAQ